MKHKAHLKIDNHSRRMFLRGAGNTLLTIPFLPSLLPKQAWGQSAPVIRRYISVHADYDIGHHQNWYPTLNQPPNVLRATGHHDMHYELLRNYLSSSSQSLSRIFGNSLNPYINQISLLKGLDFMSRISHGNGYILGNLADNHGHDPESTRLRQIRTVDQVLRDNSRFNPANRDVTVCGTPYADSMSFGYDSNGNIVKKGKIAEYPDQLYRILFNNGSYPETSGGTVGTPPHAKHDALSRTLESYRQVSNGPQISRDDRTLLENVMDLFSDILRSTSGNQQVVGQCSHSGLDTRNDGNALYSTLTLRNLANIISAAIMCDATRIVNFTARGAVGYSSIHADFHEQHSHRPFGDNGRGQVNHEFIGDVHHLMVRNFIAPLLGNLSGAIDPSNGQNYLYNSLVHYHTEAGQQHGWMCHPTMLAGNAGGNYNPGYYMDYQDRSRGSQEGSDRGGHYDQNPNDPYYHNEYFGFHINRVFVTILQAMGLSPSEYEDNSLNQGFRNSRSSQLATFNHNISHIGGYGHIGVFPYVNPDSGPTSARNYLNYNFNLFKEPLPMPNQPA